jgi:hypothetical protein
MSLRPCPARLASAADRTASSTTGSGTVPRRARWSCSSARTAAASPESCRRFALERAQSRARVSGGWPSSHCDCDAREERRAGKRKDEHATKHQWHGLHHQQPDGHPHERRPLPPRALKTQTYRKQDAALDEGEPCRRAQARLRRASLRTLARRRSRQAHGPRVSLFPLQARVEEVRNTERQRDGGKATRGQRGEQRQGDQGNAHDEGRAKSELRLTTRPAVRGRSRIGPASSAA